MIKMLDLQMLTTDAIPGRLRAGLKSFDTLDHTATVPTPNLCPEKVYMVCDTGSQSERIMNYTEAIPLINSRS